MITLRKRLLPAGLLLTATLFARAPNTPKLPVVGAVQQLRFSSQPASNAALARHKVVVDKVVRIPGATFLGFTFGKCRLAGESLLEIESLKDGDKEVFDADRIAEGVHSAYFNGDAVRFRLFAAPSTRDNAFSLTSASVGKVQVARVGPSTLCGPDGRLPTSDARVARLLFRRGGSLFVCTASLIDPVNCFLSAGHCFDRGASQHVVQFDVPASTASGVIVNPPASRQWNGMGTTASRRFENRGIGRDWAVFLTRINSTGRHAGTLRRSFFRLTTTVPLPLTNLTIRGCGTDTTPRTRNFVLQRDSGPMVLATGSVVRHRVDTEGGVSGAVITARISNLDRVIGIHTNGGCNSFPVTFNSGTSINYAPLRTAITQICNQRPDLTIDGLSTTSATLFRNNNYTAFTRIRNIGLNESLACTAGLFLSTNSTITNGDTLLSSWSVPALRPGFTSSANRSYRIPSNAPIGTCFIGAFADRGGVVSERNETNNTRALGRICADLPDLVPSAPRPSTSSIAPSQVFTVSTAIRNAGFSTSASCVSGLYLSTDSRITSTDTLLSSFTTSALAAGRSHALTLRVTAPRSLKSGTCYLGLFADRLARVRERSEANNTSAVRVTCGSAPAPDFTVTALTTSTTSWFGNLSVTARWSLRNAGNATAVAARHGLYLSTDATITTTDRLLTSVTSPSLTASSTWSSAGTIRIPTTVRSGTC